MGPCATESELNEKMATPEAKARIDHYVDSMMAIQTEHRELAILLATKRVKIEIARGIESH